MDFFIIGLTFWLLVITSLLLFFYGLLKKSSESLAGSGIAFLLPMLYFSMVDYFFIPFLLFPIVPFVMAYHMKKRQL